MVKLDEIKAGDEILISKKRAGIISWKKETVTRVTKTQIVVGIYKFRKTASGGRPSGSMIGSSIFGFYSMIKTLDNE